MSKQPALPRLADLSTVNVARAYVALRQMSLRPGEPPVLPWMEFEVPEHLKTFGKYGPDIDVPPQPTNTVEVPPVELSGNQPRREGGRLMNWMRGVKDQLFAADNSEMALLPLIPMASLTFGELAQEGDLFPGQLLAGGIAGTLVAAPAIAHGQMTLEFIKDGPVYKKWLADIAELAEPLEAIDRLVGPGQPRDAVERTLQAVGDELMSRDEVRRDGLQRGLNLLDEDVRNVMAMKNCDVPEWQLYQPLEINRDREREYEMGAENYAQWQAQLAETRAKAKESSDLSGAWEWL